MKAKIIAFLTSDENYETQSVTDAIHYFGLDEEEENLEEITGQIGAKLEAKFHTLSEVEVEAWIAEEDLESFEKFCEKWF